jgi:hypothetical protein
MAMAVASTQFADVDSKCANLSLSTPRTRKDHTLQTDPRQLAVVPATGRTRPGVPITRLCEQRVRITTEKFQSNFLEIGQADFENAIKDLRWSIIRLHH